MSGHAETTETHPIDNNAYFDDSLGNAPQVMSVRHACDNCMFEKNTSRLLGTAQHDDNQNARPYNPHVEKVRLPGSGDVFEAKYFRVL